jgi:uncharacterized integral membrane protein
MKLIKMFVLIIVLLAVVFFLTLNSETAKINLLFAQYNTFVYVIILISLGIGLIIGFLMATTSVLAAKNASRVLRSKNKKLVDELNLLRNVNIEEEPTPIDTIQEV